MKLVVMAVGSVFLINACAAKEASLSAADSVPSLGNVVAAMLAANPGWHLGTNEDCKNPGLRQKLVNNSAYQAYRAIPDLDGDGHTDRVFVLIRGDSGKLYWIPGRDGGFGAAQLVAKLEQVSTGGVYTSQRTVFFGPFDSDVGEAWTWRSEKHAFEPVRDDVNNR